MKDVIFSKKFLYELMLMTLGMGVAAIAVHFFLAPSKLIIGSISGLSIVIYRITGMPISIVSFIINSILLILAYILIGKEFGLKTVYTALILSPWLYLFETFFPVEKSIMGDPWFDLLCFVITLSAAQAVLFRINASTGGLDILAKIVNKYFHIDLGMSVSVSGAIICCSAFLINSVNLVIIGLIGTWINGLILNYFMAGLNKKKRVCIITKEYEKLQHFVISELGRGVTIYEVLGGYTNEKAHEVVVLVTKDEFVQLMEYIDEEQIQVFMTAGDVTEVYGRWNPSKKHVSKKQKMLERQLN